MANKKGTATSLNRRCKPKVDGNYRNAVWPNGYLAQLVNKDRDPWWLVEIEACDVFFHRHRVDVPKKKCSD